MLYPTVSVGNVPQLAVDVMVNTIGGKPVMHVRDGTLLPVVGDGSPFMTITTGCEVYDMAGKGYVTLPRAPPAPGRAAESAMGFVKMVEEQKLGPIFLLTSAYAGGRRDVQLQNESRFRYMVTSATADSISQHLQSLGIKALEGCGERGWLEDLTALEESIRDGGTRTPAFVSALRK